MINQEEQQKIIDFMLTCRVGTQISLGIHKDNNDFFCGFVRDENEVKAIANEQTAFEIGSVTKAFTGHILAQLVVEGRVSLDAGIDQFLDFPLKQGPNPTLRQLAWHTSGLPRLPDNFIHQPGYDPDNPYKNYGEQELITYLSELVIPEPLPGEHFAYSNLGYGVLAYVISRISGKAFAATVKEKIFTRYHMEHTAFKESELGITTVKGFDTSGNACAYWEGGILNGGIGIISTTKDMLQFGKITCDPNNAASNLQAGEKYTVGPEMKINLGWGERLLPGGITMQGINGGTGGCAASLMAGRDRKCVVTVLSNIQPDLYMENVYPVIKHLFTAL